MKAALAVMAFKYDLDDAKQAERDQWNKALRNKITRQKQKEYVEKLNTVKPLLDKAAASL